MDRIIVLCSCVVIAAGLGCAISDYGLITDNDQVANGKGSGIVNTNGKAKIVPSFQIATNWPDGTDELFSLVDQDAGGNRTITTYNNFSTGTEPTFHDDLYCNPDWQGCAAFVADDPRTRDGVWDDPWDGTFNENCPSARSLLSTLATGRYYGECGRSRIDLKDRVALMNMGEIATRFGREGLLYRLDAKTTSIRATTTVGEAMIPFRGEIVAFGSGAETRLDLTNPLLANMGRAYADFQREFGDRTTTITLTYNGLTFEQVLGTSVFGAGPSYASHILGVLRRHY